MTRRLDRRVAVYGACVAALIGVMLLIYWSPLFWTAWVWLWN
jgi:hypothetical protein